MTVIEDKRAYQQEAFRCIDQVMDKLKINLEMQTDPQMIAAILRDDMLLDDFDTVKTLLDSKLIDPKSLRPMLEKIRTGIVDKHPAVVEFLCAVTKENLIQVSENTEYYVKRTIHNIYLLDILTKEMFDNWQFMVDLRAHFLKKREQLGINSDFIRSFIDIFKISGGLFFSAKTVTMDWVFSEYERIRRQGFIEQKDVNERKMGLTLNILEAVITDTRKEFRDNAPKLFIPQVLNAQSNEYLFNRALSLWVSINFYLFRKALNKPDLDLPGRPQIATRWGEINYKYAKEYVAQEHGVAIIGKGQEEKITETGLCIKEVWDN